jgi:hypothetical protein
MQACSRTGLAPVTPASPSVTRLSRAQGVDRAVASGPAERALGVVTAQPRGWFPCCSRA